LFDESNLFTHSSFAEGVAWLAVDVDDPVGRNVHAPTEERKLNPAQSEPWLHFSAQSYKLFPVAGTPGYSTWMYPPFVKFRSSKGVEKKSYPGRPLITGGCGFTPSFRIIAASVCDVIFVLLIKGTAAS
jgi:hypothetical protein